MNQHIFFRFPLFLILLTAASAGLVLAGCVVEKLHHPFDIMQIDAAPQTASLEGHECPKPPKALKSLNLHSVYNDAHSSQIDEKAYKTYKEDYAPLYNYEKYIITLANSYTARRPGSPDHARCALEWLDSWAREDALMGEMTAQGQFTRQWALAALASGFVQIKNAPDLDPQALTRITDWFEKLSAAIIADHSATQDMRSRQNNHLYWAAWAVGISSAATQNKSHFDWAMDRTRFGLDQINADGTLDLELYRKQRALQYHVFAAIPLIYAAELGMHNGIDLYSYNDGAIHRLVGRMVSGIENPKEFAKLAGIEQDMGKVITRTQMVWIPPYIKRFPEKDASRIKALREKLGPLYLPRIGGDPDLLYPPRRGSARQPS